MPRCRGRETRGHKEQRARWEGPGRTGGEPGVTFAFTSRMKRDFPGGAVVKNPPANAGDMGSSPDLGRSHMPQSN